MSQSQSQSQSQTIVTEFASLQLIQPLSSSFTTTENDNDSDKGKGNEQQEVLNQLKLATQAQSTYSNYPVYIFKQISPHTFIPFPLPSFPSNSDSTSTSNKSKSESESESQSKSINIPSFESGSVSVPEETKTKTKDLNLDSDLDLDLDSKNTIYILSTWSSLKTHHEWIQSPINQTLMRSFIENNILTLNGIVHLSFDLSTVVSVSDLGSDILEGEDEDEDGFDIELVVWRRNTRRDLVDLNEKVEDWDRRKVNEKESKCPSLRGCVVDHGLDNDVEYVLKFFKRGEEPEVGEGDVVLQRVR